MCRPLRPIVDDDDLLPKKRSKAAPTRSARTGAAASTQMIRLMRGGRAIGVLLGGAVTMVGLMSLVGYVTDSFWVRFVVAAVVVIGFPAFVSDRFLKKTSLGGGAAMVTDIFAILLLGIALLLVAADALSKPLLVREADRYAQDGSRTMARFVYFLGGVSPVWPEERAAREPEKTIRTAGSASATPAGSK